MQKLQYNIYRQSNKQKLPYKTYMQKNMEWTQKKNTKMKERKIYQCQGCLKIFTKHKDLWKHHLISIWNKKKCT